MSTEEFRSNHWDLKVLLMVQTQRLWFNYQLPKMSFISFLTHLSNTGKKDCNNNSYLVSRRKLVDQGLLRRMCQSNGE